MALATLVAPSRRRFERVSWGVQEVLIGNVLTLAAVGIVLYPMSRRFAAGALRAFQRDAHNYL